ncbi:choice-of-anchor D domain-containing protein [Pelagicoccus sp. SDUM812003]|uniref:choice-of-anchor D domain-containing protein n=1 Tax=Pelagicoccus sp. SDUM812003 TaxID=3041267 RepID=UPI00280DBB26|nr:choice-of-anchor D domain-containing protein [Pelagicoccus sp. SDUM812003]MDQ8203601.1 choice-of-anchor D domain-containing protein [Pelagicoccus sp. SDUM812003]
MALVAAVFVSSSFYSNAEAAHTYMEVSNGTLSFPSDQNGYKIPDFSYAGYENSNKDLPEYGVHYQAKVTLNNPSGNETWRVQNAVDQVAAMGLNQYGYRGAVVLGPGTWDVDTIEIKKSGIVIRGAGEGSTIIESHVPDGRPAQSILVGEIMSPDPNQLFMDGRSGSKWDITDSVVDVGDRSFNVESGHSLTIGDSIVIEHPCTSAWLSAIGGGAPYPKNWGVGEVPIRYVRKVTAVEGSRITIDAPVFYSLVKARSQCFVYKYTGNPINKVGIENLTIDHKTNSNIDQGHQNHCVKFGKVDNCWMRNVRAQNYKAQGIVVRESSRVTFDNVDVTDPHAEVKAAHRYGISFRGAQLILAKDSYGRRNRHQYIGGGHAMDSGNVFVRCIAEDNYGASEDGHQRWANGTLFDACVFRQVGSPESNTGKYFDQKMLWMGNHGDNSNGHGWASVTGVAYKCRVQSGGYAIVAKPPTGMNYVIDCEGDFRSSHSAHGDYPGALNISTSGTLPESLFEAQLAQRLGKTAQAIWSTQQDALDFEYQLVGSESDRTFTLTNTGSDTLSGSIDVDSSVFSIVSSKSFSGLAPGSDLTIHVRYQPSEAGSDSATLTVSSDRDFQVVLGGVAVEAQESNLLLADSGTLLGAMADYGDYITTTLKDEGYAVYAVSVAQAGEYKLVAEVNASAEGSNSFYLAINKLPSSAEDTWDVVTLTDGFELREVSLRGSGAYNAPEFEPATWELAKGVHYIYLRGRETDTQLRQLTLMSTADAGGAAPVQPTTLDVKELVGDDNT